MNAIAPSLVPELVVADISRSLAFWCGLCDFTIDYERPEEGFAYITRDTAHLMIEQLGPDRSWITGPLEPPYGRGINFQIEVADLNPILEALRAAGHPLFMQPETKWYRISNTAEVGVEQFLVTDPDGYLVRFQVVLGERPTAPTR